MKLMKKLTAVVLAAAMAVSLNLPVTNVKAADWTQSGAYGAVVNYKTPENAGMRIFYGRIVRKRAGMQNLCRLLQEITSIRQMPIVDI